MADIIVVTMRPICIPFESIGDFVGTDVADVVVGGAVGAVEVVVFAFVVVVVITIG